MRGPATCIGRTTQDLITGGKPMLSSLPAAKAAERCNPASVKL